MLRKRVLIETINDQLKNICQIEHTRHRSRTNFLVNVAGEMIAYIYREKLPSLNIRVKELKQLPAFMLLYRTDVNFTLLLGDASTTRLPSTHLSRYLRRNERRIPDYDELKQQGGTVSRAVTKSELTSQDQL